MPNLKQPAAGLLATAVVVAVSVGFIALLNTPTFVGWVSYYLLCVIPMQIVIAVTWGSKRPSNVANLVQPAKGIVLIAINLLAGAVIAAFDFVTVGGSVGPPTPMLIMFAIVSVVTTFWVAIIWGNWPFYAWLRSPTAAGLAMLVVGHAIAYLIFRVFFDFRFMQGAPVYVPRLDPQGMFNAWSALVFYVTAIAAMFLVLNFELWPFTKSDALMRQPLLGTVWSLTVLLIAMVVFNAGVHAAGMDVVSFLVTVPVPFIFGSIIVLNMLQATSFSRFRQPAKGLLNALAATVLGILLSNAYGLVAGRLDHKLASGPPAYGYEIWLASALLAVTFPFLIFSCAFLDLWPFKNSD